MFATQNSFIRVTLAVGDSLKTAKDSFLPGSAAAKAREGGR